MSPQSFMLLALVLPILGAMGVVIARTRPNVREAVTLGTAVAVLACVAQLVGPVLAGEPISLQWLEPIPGLPLAFDVEPLGLIFAMVASSLWIVNSIYSIGYLRGNAESNQTRFFVCFALAIAGALAIAFSANLFTLFLFYEVLTLITYPLVTHAGTGKARDGGRTYLSILMGTSVLFFLPAIIYVWHVAGTTDFRVGGILPTDMSKSTMAMLLGLFVFGIGKAALMPFHRWLPAAMVAPTPVSALLHAVAVVKAGVFTVIKVFVYVFGLDALAGSTDWLVGLAGFTIVAASVIALSSDNLKRRLAYSTVSQLSYVILAAAILAPFSLIAAAMHIVAHAFGKITLFFAAGSIYTAAHKTEVSQLDGIGRRMPITMLAFGVGALSMIGLPPAVGFVSKWYLVLGAASQEAWWALGVIAVSTLLNASYLVPIVFRAFFRPLSATAQAHPHGEAPWPILLALVLTATGTLALFFVPDLPLALARQMVISP